MGTEPSDAAPMPGAAEDSASTAAAAGPSPIGGRAARLPKAPPPTRILHKTAMCKYFIRSTCNRGVYCQFAHGADELRPQPDLRCTKMCAMLQTTGHCDDSQCRFAHTAEQLRELDVGAVTVVSRPVPPHQVTASALEVAVLAEEGATEQHALSGHRDMSSANRAEEGEALSQLSIRGSLPRMSHAVLIQKTSTSSRSTSSTPEAVGDGGGKAFSIIVKNTFVDVHAMEQPTTGLSHASSDPGRIAMTRGDADDA